MRPITIADYDPLWPSLFAAERDNLADVLGDMVADIHHVGSTSIPGLAAKPKIDIDVVIREQHLLAEAVERVRSMDVYVYHGDPYGDGMWTFTRGKTQGSRVYLCAPDTVHHERRILFRNWLREHDEDAAAYEAIKRRLAVEADGEFKVYTGGKSAFVNEIVARAQARLPLADRETTDV